MKILVVDDEQDVKTLFEQRFRKEIRDNRVEFAFAYSGEEALKLLHRWNHEALLILSDINMPTLDGFALRQKLKSDAALQLKCIPYLFFSTAATQKAVIDAYSLSVQGFFVKQSSIAEIEATISAIMEYWKRCAAPKSTWGPNV